MHKKGTLKPVDLMKMTREESKKVIRSVPLTKMKSSRTCKSQAVGNGSKHISFRCPDVVLAVTIKVLSESQKATR